MTMMILMDNEQAEWELVAVHSTRPRRRANETGRMNVSLLEGPLFSARVSDTTRCYFTSFQRQ